MGFRGGGEHLLDAAGRDCGGGRGRAAADSGHMGLEHGTDHHVPCWGAFVTGMGRNRHGRVGLPEHGGVAPAGAKRCRQPARGGRCGGLGPRTRYAHRLGAHACRVGRKVGCGWPGLGLWASPGHRVGANWPALGPAGTDARILARG